MSFFGSTQGTGGSSASGSNNSGGNSASSWGSFLKQGLSQIESKLDKVLDMQVPIPSGSSLSAFSPHSMSTLLGPPEGEHQGQGQSNKARDSVDSRRSNIEGVGAENGQEARGSTEAEGQQQDASRRSTSSPRPSTSHVVPGRPSQDLRKSASRAQGGGARTSTSRDSDVGERAPTATASVDVDPITGMVTAAPTLRVMSSSPSPSSSPAASAAQAAAATASRERLENRMRGIFKKPAATATAGDRSSTDGHASTPPSTSTTSSRAQSPAPVSTPKLQERDVTTRTPQSKTVSARTSIAEKDGEDGKENDATPEAAITKEESPEAEHDMPLKGHQGVVAGVTTETNGEQTEQSKDEEKEPTSSTSQTDIVEVEAKPVETESHTDDAEEEKKENDEDGEPAVAASDIPHAETQATKEDESLLKKEDKVDKEGEENDEALDVEEDKDTIVKAEDARSGASEESDLAARLEPVQDDVKSAEEKTSEPPTTKDEPLSEAEITPTEPEKAPTTIVQEDLPNKVEPPSKETYIQTTSSEQEEHSTPVVAAVTTEPTSSVSSESIHPAQAHLAKVVEQREQQLFKVMQEHSQLLERHRDLEDAKAAEQQLLTSKIAGLEGIIEQQKKELDMARSAASATAGTPKSMQRTLDEQKRLLEEKDEQIRGLLAEGEVLSKKEFKNLTTIKTLRTKNIEMERAQQDLQQKLEKSQAACAEAQMKVTRLTEEQRQLNDSVRTLTEQNTRQNKQLGKLEADLNQMRADKADLQLRLDGAWQELEDARKVSNELSLQATQTAIENERKQNEELLSELKQLQKSHESLVDHLRQEIQDLRVSLSNRDEAAGEVEDQLRAEIRSLQGRLEQTDGDAFEIQEAIEEARRPLQRQFESLQAQHHASIRHWERIEKQLTNRVHDAEEDLVKAQNREKAAKEKLDAMKTQMMGFEARLDTLRSADTQLRTELSAAKRQCLEKEEALKAAQAELSKERVLRERAIEEAKEDESRRSKLAQQEEVEMLKGKIKQLQQQLSAKEEQQQQSQQQHQQWTQDGPKRRESSNSVNIMDGGVGGGGIHGYVPERQSFDSTTGSIDSVGMSRSNSVLGMIAASKGLPSSPPLLGSPSLMGLGGTGGSGSPAVAIERLSSMVRQLEGQVAFLNEQVRTSTKNKDELSEELVKMSMELETLQSAAAKVPALEQDLQQLKDRHAAALELLGEKTEEAQELKADLADVKEAYRDQLNELLGQLDKYRKSGTGM